jgi:hypothetical protein
MPQLVAFVVAGAGLYAGYRWVTRELKRVGAAARATEDRQRAGGPRDLGALEWDEHAQVYRPKHKI